MRVKDYHGLLFKSLEKGHNWYYYSQSSVFLKLYHIKYCELHEKRLLVTTLPAISIHQNDDFEFKILCAHYQYKLKFDAPAFQPPPQILESTCISLLDFSQDLKVVSI